MQSCQTPNILSLSISSLSLLISLLITQFIYNHGSAYLYNDHCYQMSVHDKSFYFLTNRSTHFRYFVDNTSAKPQRYIFYPQKYQKMTDGQIRKYERSLVRKFMWWGIFNTSKLLPNDYQILKSRLIDITVFALFTLGMARSTRLLFFRQEMMFIEGLMQLRNMDVKFWKATTAYLISFGIGYKFIKQVLEEQSLSDLAVEYSPNFTNELKMAELEPQLNKFYSARFPWLNETNANIQK